MAEYPNPSSFHITQRAKVLLELTQKEAPRFIYETLKKLVEDQMSPSHYITGFPSFFLSLFLSKGEKRKAAVNVSSFITIRAIFSGSPKFSSLSLFTHTHKPSFLLLKLPCLRPPSISSPYFSLSQHYPSQKRTPIKTYMGFMVTREPQA